MRIYSGFLDAKAKHKKLFALLIDPDKTNEEQLKEIVHEAIAAHVDYFFVGGSLIVNDYLDSCVKFLKENSVIPVILFPGSSMQICNHADAILFLSLISGRNPDMLIGRHVESAPRLRMSPLEIISTGYILIESGLPTAVSYMSNTTPIPANKNDIARCTAMAGELLGLKVTFLDGGSGAQNPISTEMIEAVSKSVLTPLIVGGGIHTPEKAIENCEAGADIIVAGNSIERDIRLIKTLADAVHSVKGHMKV